MADSRPLKRTKITTYDKDASNKSITCGLPTEILLDITLKVASQSLSGLCHLRLTSKEMLNITNDDDVYKHASLNTVPFFRFQEIPQEASFLSHCRSNGNLESLYREGMEVYFTNLELYKKGLDMVHKAAQKGHKRSMYAFAMIVLISSDTMRIGFLGTQEFEDALGYLRFLRNQKCVLQCRSNVAEFIRYLRWNNMRSDLVMQIREHLCNNAPCTNTWRLKIGSWCFMTEEDDENDPNMCENCRWDHEVEEFCTMI
ncbi:uncharacterized protein LOC114754569 [Neltuma alba]|uniref:uncharacterized protein LOC114754569 n=1 Tax=Neltuma alba TaxID=207710 RepID=UPI0010A4F4AF|nr:uncharacterized protein LOC114754569 [Prosopis alba]